MHSRNQTLRSVRLYAASLILGLLTSYPSLAQETYEGYHIYGELEYGQTMEQALSVAEDMGFDTNGNTSTVGDHTSTYYDYSFYSKTRVYGGPQKFGVPTEIQFGFTEEAGLQAVIVRLFSNGRRPTIWPLHPLYGTGRQGTNRLSLADLANSAEAIALYERLNAAISQKYGRGDVAIGSENLECPGMTSGQLGGVRLKKKTNGYYEYEFRAMTKYEPNVSVVIEPTCDVAVLYFAPNAGDAFEEDLSRRDEESAEDF